MAILQGSLEVPHIAQACGNDYPDEMVATQPLFVTFHSDEWDSGAGFEMTYIRNMQNGEHCNNEAHTKLSVGPMD